MGIEELISAAGDPKPLTLEVIDAFFDEVLLEPDSLIVARDPTDGVVKIMTAAEFGEKHSRKSVAK